MFENMSVTHRSKLIRQVSVHVAIFGMLIVCGLLITQLEDSYRRIRSSVAWSSGYVDASVKDQNCTELFNTTCYNFLDKGTIGLSSLEYGDIMEYNSTLMQITQEGPVGCI